MLDIGFVERIFLHLAADRRIIDLLLDLRVDLELGADLLDDPFLGRSPARFLEACEQILDLAVVAGQQLEPVFGQIVI
jgi:hypothetical protein